MRLKMNRRRALVAIGACAVLAAAAFGIHAYLVSPTRGLPDNDAFTQENAGNWDAFGGTWDVADGGVRNESDERGAKLLAGSTYWRNYSIEADVKMLGPGGDAGLILRSSGEEQGVDAYYGYYAGLRSRDDKLVLGRAGYGWTEALTTPNPAEVRIVPLKWYHLKLLAYGCQIAAVATVPGNSTATATVVTDPDCIHSGRAGLRSYGSGGVWRNVIIRPATAQDMAAAVAIRNANQAAAGIHAGNPAASQQFEVAKPRSDLFAFHDSANTQPISSLRLTSFVTPASATIRGSVVLTAPVLVVQDSTGGVSVPQPASAPALKLGDHVEVSGRVHLDGFNASLAQAKVRLLWEGTPLPPVTVSASEAASGAFDSAFIEVEGRLRNKSYGPDNTLVFSLDSGPQSFRAVMARGRGDYLFDKLKINSRLRMRGVAMTSSSYTGYQVPFVLLLRSSDDVDVLAGPPWWSARHLIAAAFTLLALALVAIFFYGRIERWRLRAVLDERERMAHEIHDTLGQSFAGIGFQLEAIRGELPQTMRSVHEQLDLASDLVHRSHAEARRSIATLRPEQLESEDLLTCLHLCAQRMVEGGAVEIRTVCSGNVSSLPARIAEVLYRIGQEAIANAVQHARPATITIRLLYEKDRVTLGVADDGAGFAPDGDLQGFGLSGMRKRAARIAARFHLLSEPGRGTSIQVIAPLPPPVTWKSWPRVYFKYLKEYRPHANAGELPRQSSHH